MTSMCFLCGATHDWRDCPRCPRPPAPPLPVSWPEEQSLAPKPDPTLLEQLYGQDALLHLHQLLDDPELERDHQDLLQQLLSGDKHLDRLSTEERRMANDMGERLYYGPKPRSQSQRPRPLESDWRPQRVIDEDEDVPPTEPERE